MNHGLVDDSPVTEMLHHDSFKETGSHLTIPDPLRIHDHNRPAAANAEAWRLAALDAAGAEEQSFTLEQHR